jgi:predicted kinase
VATLFLLVGLPGAGKTTAAKRIAVDHRALRLSPDEWMLPLFGESEANGKRDVLEGRLIALALQVLRLGTNVVLDFGLWARDERSSLRWLAASVGSSSAVVYVPVSRETQLRRIRERWERTPHQTFPMTETDVDEWRAKFQEPDDVEQSGGLPGDPPPRCVTWFEWAANRWPSLADDAN